MAEEKQYWTEAPEGSVMAPYSTYPAGQTALMKQLKHQVKIEYIPFKFFPWSMMRKSMTPLLMKILIDG